jgi:hypothetical protein
MMLGRPAACLLACVTMTSVSGCGSRQHTSHHVHESAAIQMGLMVFSHPVPSATHLVMPELPRGAVLANVSGHNRVYVSQQSIEGNDLMQRSYICITDVEHGHPSSATCSPSEKVEREGLLTVRLAKSQVRLGILLPNGVSSVAVIDRDGARHSVAVFYNFVEFADNRPVAVEYELLGGRVHKESIPAAFINPPPRAPR